MHPPVDKRATRLAAGDVLPQHAAEAINTHENKERLVMHYEDPAAALETLSARINTIRDSL